MKDNKNQFIEADKHKKEDLNNENTMIWPVDADEEEVKELLKEDK